MFWWANKRIHSSWIVMIICFGIVIGVMISGLISGYLFNSFLLVVSFILLPVCFVKKSLYLVPVIFLAGLFVGIWRGSLMQSDIAEIKRHHNSTVVIEGRVRDDADENDSGYMIIKLDNLLLENRKNNCVLWITTSKVSVKRGDYVVIGGKLTSGFGSYAGAIYKADLKNIKRNSKDNLALSFRDWFVEKIKMAIPEPKSSLGIGFLVGQKTSLSADLTESLQMAGLTHIIVASGYNLTILIRIARRLFSKISKYLSAMFSCLLMAFFIGVTGLSPSMTRAGLVSFLCLMAWYCGRKFHPIVILSIVMALTLIINPGYAWGDIGWQLSFLAFAGVMILAPLIHNYFFGKDKPKLFGQVLCEAVSSQIATLPVVIYNFGQLSNVAIFTNILILPFVPLAMFLTFLSGILASIFSGLAVIFGTPADLLLSYMVKVTEFFANLSWSVSAIEITTVGVVVCYLLLIIVCVFLWRITGYKLSDNNLVE